MNRGTLAAGAVAALVCVTGCSAETAGSPQPDPSSDAPTPISTPVSSANAALPHSGAPKVLKPLPAAVLDGDPCADALKPAQISQALGVAVPGEPGELTPLGKTCDWKNRENRARAGVIYDTKTGQGLSSRYQNVKPQATTWRELTAIQGFPAVAAVAPGGGLLEEFCQVTVGVADNLSFDAGVFLSDAKRGKADPCEGAAKVADMVVTNLRQKAGA